MKFSYAEEYFFPVVMKDVKLFDFEEDGTEEELLRKKKDDDLFDELFRTIDDDDISELLKNNI